MFKSAADRFTEASELRKVGAAKKLKFGISYLDKALRGIFHDDVILLSAASGAGKTQAALLIALTNLREGKNVFFFALEAARAELENRMLFPHVMDALYADPNRPALGRIEYSDWIYGDFNGALDKYEAQAQEHCKNVYANFNTYYKTGGFTVADLIEEVSLCADDADLIIVDHAHFFSFGDKNETQGLKEIVETVRDLALNHGVPILLIAHMRKRDKLNGDLVPGMEELHGSSDLYKMATRVITMAPGPRREDGKYATFLRICKDRHDSGATRFIAQQIFDPRKRHYEPPFAMDWAERRRDEEFQLVAEELLPHWARKMGV